MRSTVAYISKSNLVHNLNRIRSFAPNSKILAIVKANAYGHGIIGVSRILREENVEYLGVAFAEEGILMRKSGDYKPIIVLVPALPEEASQFCEYNLQPVASTVEFMQALSREAVKQQVHIKSHLFIGTGMNREGVQPWDAVEFMDIVSKLPNIEVIGVCTHFASSSTDEKFTFRQLNLFKKTIAELKEAGYEYQYIHAANSGAIANYSDTCFNLVRPGIFLYGYAPEPYQKEKMNVKPVLELKTHVIMSRAVKAGEGVSYERLFIADKPTNIVTLPIGYGDGFARGLTPNAECLIKGKRYKIVGSICMDECMADVGDDIIPAGEEVVIIGKQGDEQITAEDLANKLGTIHWEILTNIAARVPRRVVE